MIIVQSETKTVALLLLSLWGRYFFHVYPGHWVPACVSISRSETSTITDPESHANSTLVDFLTDSFDVGVSFYSRHLSCRLHRQWHLVLNTPHRWEWNTIVCSNDGSQRDEDCHSRRLATLWYRMFCWKCIPLKWPKEGRSGRWTEILFRFSWIRKVLWDRLEANILRMFRIHLIPLLKLLYLPCENDAE